MRKVDPHGRATFMLFLSLLESNLEDPMVVQILRVLSHGDSRKHTDIAEGIIAMIVASYSPTDLKRGRKIAIHQFREWAERLEGKGLQPEVDSRVCDAMCSIAEATLISEYS